MNRFLKDQFPNLSDAQLARIDHYYPKAIAFLATVLFHFLNWSLDTGCNPD
jgi:hypothetical protein